MQNPNEKQVGGLHYKSEYQHWDFMLDVSMPYLPAQVIKYITRWKKKNGVQDLEKAAHFLDKYILTMTNQTLEKYAKMNKYIEENQVESGEAFVIQHLMNFHIGMISELQQAADIIKGLIESTRS
jgi:hypothetical protein